MLLPGHARPPPAPQPAQHPGLRRQVEPPGQLLRLFYCTVLVCSKEIAALTDFSDELKNKTVCEDQELTLHCHPSKLLNIYSAAYGRRTQERDVCAPEAEQLPPFDCLSYSALQVLSRRCYGKQRCKIIVNNHHFGSPCLPGVKKYLTVTYACGGGRDIRLCVTEEGPGRRQQEGDIYKPRREAAGDSRIANI
uniref:Eva-1 homolog C n=1 Tax=Equus caballus TaxID=9796 RepID=A0A9L0S4A3_HORSE